MNRFAAVAVALALVAGDARAAPADGSDAPWALLPGDDGADHLPFLLRDLALQPSQGALALTVVDGLWHLVPATVSTRFVIADGQGAVEVDGTPADARVYLRLPGLAEGKIDTPDMRFRGAARLLTAPLPMVFKGATWRLEPEGEFLTLALGGRRQRLGYGTDDEAMRRNFLVWAGDLDGDGRLDLILRTTVDLESTWCVWLSGRAVGGQLAGRAACITRHR